MPQTDVLSVPARRRIVTSGVAGAVFGALVAPFAPWELALLVGWDTAAALLVVRVLRDIIPADAAQTRAWAAREDGSHRGAVGVITISAGVSLVGVVLALVEARGASAWIDALLTAAAALAVVLSWGLVHLVYTLRYAHLYYFRDQPGGIDFHDDGQPDYHDFAYFAYAIGMSFAVSDPDVTDRTIRRTVMQHALVSYLFGAVIVGTTINVMAGFIR